MLVGVPAGRVDGDEADVGILEQRPRARREVLEPRPDGEDDIGPPGDGIGGDRAGDPDRAGVVRVVVQERRLAGDGLDDRDAVLLGEGPERVGRPGVVDATTGDEERPAALPSGALAAASMSRGSGPGRRM